MISEEYFVQQQKKLEDKIISFRNDKAVWTGYLSSSALSTAVATFALWSANSEKNRTLVKNGLNWLVENINSDGGFGDTIKSKSNLSTTLLCWSTFAIVKSESTYIDTINKIENWLLKNIDSLEPELLSKAVLNHYKTDRTFSVPILAMCALSGRLGKDGWKYVPQLPYQFAVFPDRFFKLLNLSVVSYAIPALISMGLVRSKMKPPINPLMRLLNKLVYKKVLNVLDEKQPSNGGFLEATPLTGFVLMTMIGAGNENHIVCKRAEEFLINSIREDGSWPIDTNLTTWVTTLAINSFTNDTFSKIEQKEDVLNWILSQQINEIHPFTKSKPGGWAWIDLEGGVPDGDDTAGALLALKRFYKEFPNVKNDAFKGIEWLISIQNNDGGFPTFCRGWGKLPFDASCADITAHVLRAFQEWINEMELVFQIQIKESIKAAIRYLKNCQREDGSWLPLWFGNEEDENHLNPVYGTAQVIYGLKQLKDSQEVTKKIIEKGEAFLNEIQNSDGGWGGNKNIISSIEETALAVRALIDKTSNEEELDSIQKGIKWLLYQIDNNCEQLEAKPIGLYFASLWYYENMYPYVYANSALTEYNSMYDKNLHNLELETIKDF